MSTNNILRYFSPVVEIIMEIGDIFLNVNSLLKQLKGNIDCKSQSQICFDGNS